VVRRQTSVGKRGQVRRLLALFAVAAAIALGSWSSASANVLKVTDLGTVVGGYDGLGLFGTAGSDLVGDSYEAVFTFDLSGLSGVFNDGSQAYAYGGQVFVGSSTFVSEIVTIDGASAPSFGESAGEILAENGSTFSAQSHCAASVTPVFTYPTFSLTSYISADYFFAPNDSIPLDYSQSGTYTSADYSMYASFDAFSVSLDLQTGRSTGNWTAADVMLSSVTVSSVTVSDPPSPTSVPEPSTWAMMLLGATGLGYAGYRTSRKAIAA
jgi:PEP-CTERM motif